MRGWLRAATGLAMLAGFTAGARAQISLSSAVDLALRNDPRMRMAQAEVTRARAALAETHDAYVPNIGVNGGYGQATGVPLNVPVVFSLASQSLLFNFSQKDNVRAAASGLKAAELAEQEAHDQIAEDVLVTYLNLEHEQQSQSAMMEEYGFASRLVTIVQERLSAGDDTQIELLKARKTAAQIHLQKLETDDQIAILSDHLSRLVGLPGNQLLAVPSSVPALPSVDSLTVRSPESFGIQSAFDNARAKRETAFGEARYRYRPQVSFALNYSRIDTGPTNYVDYYPQFAGKSRDAASIGVQIVIPLFDRGHQDRAHEAAAEAAHAWFDAENQENQFLEGRFKLQHSAAELADRSDLAGIDRDLAESQLNAVLAELSADNAATGGTPMTPKDEQNARVQERARYVDLLNAEFELKQAQVNLLRQTGQLDSWLNTVVTSPDSVTATPVAH